MSGSEQSKPSANASPSMSPIAAAETSKSTGETNLGLHAQRDAIGQWNISKQAERPEVAELAAKEIQFQVPLPKGDGLVIRLREDVRIPSDGSAPLRFVYKFPAPERSAETAGSGEGKRGSTNDSGGAQ